MRILEEASIASILEPQLAKLLGREKKISVPFHILTGTEQFTCPKAPVEHIARLVDHPLLHLLRDPLPRRELVQHPPDPPLDFGRRVELGSVEQFVNVQELPLLEETIRLLHGLAGGGAVPVPDGLVVLLVEWV